MSFQPGDQVKVREDATVLTELSYLRGKVGSVLSLPSTEFDAWVEFEGEATEFGFDFHELESA